MTDLKNAYIRLRVVEPSDATFILEVRLDPSRNTFLMAVDDDIEKQAAWIRSYKEREARGDEYYFVIESLEGEGLGLVRVYDLRPDSFSWGSWVIKPGAPPQTAISSALLIYAFGFEELAYPQSHFEVLKGNQKVVDFHLRMGATIVSESETHFFFNFPRSEYDKLKSKYTKYLRTEG